MAGKYNIKILQGSTFTLSITWKNDAGDPINLTGYKARMQIRYGSADGEMAAELTTEDGKIVIDPVISKITLQLSAVDTSKITDNGVYDLEMVKGDIVTRLLEGKVTISREVTK